MCVRLKLLERGQTKYYLQNKTNISHYYWGCTYRDSFFKDSFVEDSFVEDSFVEDSFVEDSFVEDSFVEGSCSFSDQDGVTDKYRQVMGLLSKAVTTNLPTLLHICSVLQGSIVLVA